MEQFDSITLAEMDGVELMDRTDMKFNFHVSSLEELLEKAKEDYRVLEVAGTRMTHYETLYYDTPSYDLFLQHHNGRTTRCKIRLRRYVESDLNFFELKHKNNKGRTLKTRIARVNLDKNISESDLQLISGAPGVNTEKLEPKMWVNYIRITLVNKHEEERLTIDIDLHVKTDDQTVTYDGLVIVETKQVNASDTVFVRNLRKKHIREGGTSKYCLAVSSLVEHVKKNNFKPGVNQVKKIIHGKNIH